VALPRPIAAIIPYDRETFPTDLSEESAWAALKSVSHKHTWYQWLSFAEPTDYTWRFKGGAMLIRPSNRSEPKWPAIEIRVSFLTPIPHLTPGYSHGHSPA